MQKECQRTWLPSQIVGKALRMDEPRPQSGKSRLGPGCIRETKRLGRGAGAEIGWEAPGHRAHGLNTHAPILSAG